MPCVLQQTYCFESESCVEIKTDGSCEESTPGHHCVSIWFCVLHEVQPESIENSVIKIYLA